jgi:hypothetical protein
MPLSAHSLAIDWPDSHSRKPAGSGAGLCPGSIAFKSAAVLVDCFKGDSDRIVRRSRRASDELRSWVVGDRRCAFSFP